MNRSFRFEDRQFLPELGNVALDKVFVPLGNNRTQYIKRVAYLIFLFPEISALFPEFITVQDGDYKPHHNNAGNAQSSLLWQGHVFQHMPLGKFSGKQRWKNKKRGYSQQPKWKYQR